jgi:hypothetical protein
VKIILGLTIFALGVALRSFAPLTHPFPGSTLTIAPEMGSLKVKVTIPVPVLSIARPTLTGLDDTPKNASLSALQQKDLDLYLQEHISLTPADQPALDLQLINAHVQDAENADVGRYDLLVIEMAAPLLADQSLNNAILSYDVVLHEVRNHHATVWLARAGHDALPLGEIRFDAALGRARPLVLSVGLPQDQVDNSGMPSLYTIAGVVAALSAMSLVYKRWSNARRSVLF